MPIRMEQDDPRQNNQGNNRNQGNSGNRNALLRILPLILLFLFRKPKWSIPILLIGAVWFFFFGGQEMLLGPTVDNETSISPYELGATLSQERFDSAKVFEPLSYGYGQSGLPARVTLEDYAPSRAHQGRQGSCVGWASAYAARTILEARATGQSPDRLAFSPAYLYNQIHLPNCQGAYMLDAMKAMSSTGALPINEFAYDEQTCSRYPSRSQLQQGQQHRITGYNRLTLGGNNYQPDLMAIKQHLAQGAPVVIGMMVGGSFMTPMRGQEVWRPSRRDYNMQGFGGHAMCIIGYDDQKEGGSFQIMNSWGSNWGRDGIAWVRYPDFEHFTREAYGLHPMGSADDRTFDDNLLAVEFGIFDTQRESILPMEQVGDIVFRTLRKVSTDDKFKVLFANSIECNVYIFGEETDGSSYVLFPYTDKHSPYCGITGTRLFPKDYSMSPDDLGNRDRIAIVVSKEPLNFQALNQRINGARGNTYAEKLKNALGDLRIRTTRFQTGNTIQFEAERDGRNAVAMVLEIDK